MRLICPSCVAQYEIDEDVIPSEGRDVQCANCGHTWFQDSVNMLSSATENTVGVGDPDGDVPPELFNDLEGKLDTTFSSTRATTAEPEVETPSLAEPVQSEPAPDVSDITNALDTDLPTIQEDPLDQLAQAREPTMPSSQLDQDVLDMLHDEAAHSTGETPPAAREEAVEIAPEQPQEIPEPVATAPEGNDNDLDEIRRRISGLEGIEETLYNDAQGDKAPADDNQYEANIPAEDDFIAANIAAEEPKQSDNPFYRPGSERRSAEAPASEPAPLNIYDDEPVQKTSIETSIDDFVQSAGNDSFEDSDAFVPAPEPRKPEHPVKARAFPMDSAADIQNNDIETGAPTTVKKSRGELLPDIDELSSEIIKDSTGPDIYDTPDETVHRAKRSKRTGGFLRGLLYGLVLLLLIAVLYLLKPSILGFIPQAAPIFDLLTSAVDGLLAITRPLMASIVEMLNGLIGG